MRKHVIPCLAVAWNALWLSPVVFFAFLGVVLSQHDTIYAPQYSERAFAQVVPGASPNEVQAPIGSPLSTAASGPFRHHHYTAPGPTFDNYEARVVTFRAEQVDSTHSWFHQD